MISTLRSTTLEIPCLENTQIQDYERSKSDKSDQQEYSIRQQVKNCHNGSNTNHNTNRKDSNCNLNIARKLWVEEKQRPLSLRTRRTRNRTPMVRETAATRNMTSAKLSLKRERQRQISRARARKTKESSKTYCESTIYYEILQSA